MAYNTVITLARAKNYLRIDPAFTLDDSEIESMIKAALQMVEVMSNHIVYERSITLNAPSPDGCWRIYHTPLNTSTVVDQDGLLPVLVPKNGFYIAEPQQQITSLTYNAGYADPEDIPAALIQSALQMVKVWYYESEKQVNTTLVPESVKESLNQYKHFTL